MFRGWFFVYFALFLTFLFQGVGSVSAVDCSLLSPSIDFYVSESECLPDAKASEGCPGVVTALPITGSCFEKDGGCVFEMPVMNKCVPKPPPNIQDGCDTIANSSGLNSCGSVADLGCLGTAPSCGGTCGDGYYCRAKTSDPSQCVCAVSEGTGCNGGYLYECRSSCTGYWDPGGGLSCPSGEVSCRSCCTLDYPGAPTLLAPANGAILTDTNISLTYSPPFDWGGDCGELPNPTSILKMGLTPESLTEVTRFQEARATSAVIVGSNIEITGIGFGATGSQVQVRLDYQSAATSFAGTPAQVIAGYAKTSTGYTWATDPDNVGWNSFCQSMVGKTGWNPTTGMAWFSYLQGANWYHGPEYYWDANLLCMTYDGNPSATSTYNDSCTNCGCADEYCSNPCPTANNPNKCCGYGCSQCDSCTLPNTTLYNSTAAYTSSKEYVGTYSVQSDGKIRIPIADLPAGGISGSLGISAGVTKNTDGFDLVLAPGTYYWQVVADNGAEIVGPVEGTMQTASPVWSFTINSGISGTVYYDPDNTCSTGTPTGLTGGMSVTYDDGSSTYNQSIASTGTATGQFSLDTPAGSGSLTLNNIPTGYSCSVGCGSGCPVMSGVASQTQNNNFFLTDRRVAWWQTEGAGVYAGSLAGGTTIRSLIPDSVPVGERYLVLPGSGQSGLVMRASGATSLLEGSVNSNSWSAMSQYKGKRTDFTFFASKLGRLFVQPNDWAVDTLTKPTYIPTKEFWYMDPTSGTATISAPWTVANGESYALLVDGAVAINANITVNPGGFLAIIARGNITVNPSVTGVAGLLVTDGQFVTATAGLANETQLTISGSTVAWGGMSLLRDMGAANTTEPAERFVYRPDIVSAMPTHMKMFMMQWQEIPAGSLE